MNVALAPRGNWFLAGLAGGGAALLAAIVALTIWMWSGGGYVESVQNYLFMLAMLTFWGAFAAFPTAFFLIGMMAIAERRTPKPLALWLVLGAAASLPVATGVWGVSHLGDCFDSCPGEAVMSLPALAILGVGLIGALVARRVRHGRWA